MLPDDDSVDWMFHASTRWLEGFGGYAEFAERTQLLTPTEDDFPVDVSLEGDALAQDYFAFVLEHAGVTDWPFELEAEAGPNAAEILRGMPHHMTDGGGKSARRGRRLGKGDPFSVRYAPSQLNDPVALVASMARGVSHYHLYSASTVLADDESDEDVEDREFLVDLGAVFLGFGVFLANSAFRFEQHESGAMAGWGYSRQGALSELDVSYALAVVATLLDVPEREVRPHLRPNPREFFRDALRHLEKKRRADLDALRAVRGASTAPYR